MSSKWKKYSFYASLFGLLIYVIAAFFAPVIATKYPYKTKAKEEVHYPAWRHFAEERLQVQWSDRHNQELQEYYDNSNGGLVSFEPNYIDLSNVNSSPPGSFKEGTSKKHYLGTDKLGRDVMSGLIHGAHTSLSVAFLSVLIGLLIAFLLGLPSSYLGNNSISFSVLQIIILIAVSIILFIFIFITYPFPFLKGGWFIIRLLAFVLSIIGIAIGIKKITPNKNLTVNFPLDLIMMRVIEFIKSIPTILILLVCMTFLKNQNIIQLSLVIGALIWMNFYRYIRASIFEQKNGPFYETLVNLGFSDRRILLRHFVPSIVRVLVVPIIFSMISVILFEATISFLGIGISDDVVSWGKILSSARNDISAWWVAVFPGFAILLLIVILNRIGTYLLEEMKQ